MRARRDAALGGTLRAIGLAVLAAGLLAEAAAGTTITIVNLDGAGEGLNDPAPVAPVGGNPGTTLGAQRLYVLQYAADVWETVLPSTVEIRVQAAFNGLSCTATTGVLGSAGPISTVRDDPGGNLLANHWYHVALANKLVGSDQIPGSNDINTQLNSNIGQTGCLETSSWYYGVDGNAGAGQIDLLGTVLHEFGHGLGFSTTTSGSSGGYLSGSPHIYDHFLYDNVLGLHWDQMTAGQRVASANGCTRLVWDGANVTLRAPAVLADKPILRVNAPPAIDGDYEVGTAAFGPPLTSSALTDVVLVDDGTGTTTDGCEALINGAAVSGKLALIDRGNCPFTQKVTNAQNAGAIGVIIADNVAGCPPAGLGGVDPTITIPSVRITLADGNTIKANLPGVNASLTRDPTQIAGADASGRVKMYTPSTFASGSSVSHWDTSADPDLLMEPFATPLGADLVDLTRWHFADIGWFDGLTAVGEPTAGATPLLSSAPNPFGPSTTIQMAMKAEGEAELSIYDLVGRRVAVLHRGVLPAGNHAFEWRGLDDSGRRLPPGVYLSRARVGGVSEGGRLVMWR